MNTKELKRRLEREEIDVSSFDEIIEETKNKDSNFKEDFGFLSSKRLKGALETLSYFRSFFSAEEYGKLVCKKLISYTKIHAIFLSTTSPHKELNVKTFANPNIESLPFIEASCSPYGSVKFSNHIGYQLQLVSL